MKSGGIVEVLLKVAMISCDQKRGGAMTVEWTKRADRKVYNIVHLKYVSCGDISEVIQQSCCFAVSRVQRLIC